MTKHKHFKNKRKALTLLLALALLTIAVTGTIAYLFMRTEPVVNTFTPSNVPSVPKEEFDGTTKTEIKVKNEGNIAAYVRVKLVTYRVNEKNEHIGGTATVPDFTLGTGWFEEDGYYYYKKPVQPNQTSENLLGTSITLQQYTDADGGKQVIEVISESIQSVPTSVVTQAWGVTVDSDGNLKESN